MEETEDLAFEEALVELESVVERLEGEGLTLDETLALYERGRDLADHCQHLLDTVELRVEQLTTGGEPEAVPFTPESSP
ncbi:MAG: exodeoxyribonuclease VII small subunit [Anaerolineae bacterium]